jgi:carbon storage regulator CsrA
MLVLSRKHGEKLVIDPGPGGLNIVVTFCTLKSGAALIGVEAPKNMKVYREELLTARERKGA